jgi:tetratricopeptide (TPR) repeat protein
VTAEARSDNKLVWRVSASLDAARPGEVLLLDEDGQVLGPGAMRRAAVVGWGVVGGIVGLGAVAVTALAGPVLGIATGAATLGILAHHARAGREFRRALALASAGRRDEALAAVQALEGRHLGEQFPPFIDYLTGKLEWQRGHFDAALGRYERARGRLVQRRRGRGMYWVCSFDRAQLLAAMGNVDGARTARLELDDAPRGDYFAMELALTDLMIAFHAGDPSDLPPDEDLYDWAKSALRTSRFGVSVALLAWAFAGRGDDEMARHMLREAPGRLATEFLPESAPRLSRWLDDQLAELPPDPDLE